jgi:hypothetical protein
MDKLPLGLAMDLRQVVPYKTGSWRTLKPLYIMQTPPCAHGCPINNDIRGFLRVLADKEDYAEAWHILTRTNPLPAICGRVCPHPCEDGCTARTSMRPAINSSAGREPRPGDSLGTEAVCPCGRGCGLPADLSPFIWPKS